MEYNHGQLQYHVESCGGAVDSVAMSPDTGSGGGGSCDAGSSTRVVGGRRSSGRVREPLEPLIVAALRSAPGNKMLVTDIYRYIESHSEHYRDDSASQPSSSTSTDTGR